MTSPVVLQDTISVDLRNDLQDGSHLKRLLEANSNAIFDIGSELARFADRPVQVAIGLKPVQIKIQAPATWNTTTGVGFSLSPSASCTISIGDTSTKFAIAKSIESSETEDVFEGPFPGKVYVNMEFDFDISGNVSGSGSAMGIGITGKAKGSAAATLAFCHAVNAGMKLKDAITEALSSLVFPFEPDCALQMAVDDIGKVNFDGSLNCELDVTYSFGNFKFSAPSVDSARQSLGIGFEKFSLPSFDVESGVKATFTYVHSDHFGAIVSKSDARNARLYLVRSATNETGASVGITVGVSTSGNLSATVDKTALAQAVNKLTGGGGDKVAAIADQLQSGLASKANQWLSSQKGDMGLLAQLSKQTNRALLYTFNVDLSKADLATQTWEQFSHGDLRQAAALGGMTLLPGSGVTSELKQSVSIGLHFFNLFKLQDTSTYFQNCRAEIGPDSTVRFLYDIGKEHETDIQNTMEKSRIHFVATATEAARNDVEKAEVDLYIELSESGKPAEANRIADSIGSLPASHEVQDLQSAMRQFVATNKNGTLSLVAVLKPPAYQRIACSEYTGAKHDLPPALPQEQDKDNWEAFREGAETLLHLSYVSTLTYFGWEQFNLICNGETKGVPDRRNPGNPNAVTSDFYGNLQNVKEFVSYFYLSSAQFMNLCDDLHALAGTVGAVNTDALWDGLLSKLVWLVKNDVNNDWSKPAARALFQLCSGTTVASNRESAQNSLTCTITLA